MLLIGKALGDLRNFENGGFAGLFDEFIGIS
jgi:hypothetical protein